MRVFALRTFRTTLIICLSAVRSNHDVWSWLASKPSFSPLSKLTNRYVTKRTTKLHNKNKPKCGLIWLTDCCLLSRKRMSRIGERYRLTAAPSSPLLCDCPFLSFSTFVLFVLFSLSLLCLYSFGMDGKRERKEKKLVSHWKSTAGPYTCLFLARGTRLVERSCWDFSQRLFCSRMLLSFEGKRGSTRQQHFQTKFIFSGVY